MHPITHAQTRPDHPAIIMAASGETDHLSARWTPMPTASPICCARSGLKRGRPVRAC